MSSRLEPLDDRPETLSLAVFNAIHDAIVDKRLAPGHSTSEARVATDLKVSKTPVREALLRLKELGLVEHDGNRGLRVVLPSRHVIVSVYEARRTLDSAVAVLAASRATEAERGRLEEEAYHSVLSAEARDAQDFSRWDRVFHDHVAEAARSPQLTELTKNAFMLAGVLRARDVPATEESISCAREHVAIAEAIMRDNGTLASQLAAEHVQHVLTKVLSLFPGTFAT